MNRNPKGQYIKELEKPTLMSFYVEYETRSWLREEALKKKTKISDLIRYYIQFFKKSAPNK